MKTYTQLVVDGKGNFFQGVATGKISMSLQTTLMKLVGPYTKKRKKIQKVERDYLGKEKELAGVRGGFERVLKGWI